MQNPSDKGVSILVTGASGMLGYHITKYLFNAGYSNVLLASKNIFNAPYPILTGDIRDWNYLNKIVEGRKIVINAAGMISYHEKDYNSLIEINTKSVASLVDLCIANEATLIQISSTSTLKRDLVSESVNEEDIWKAKMKGSSYSVSKFYGELEWQRGIAEGMNGYLLLPSVIIPEEGFFDRNFGKNIPMLDQGFSNYPTGSGGFISVTDVCNFILQCIEGNIPKGKYILNSVNESYRNIFEIIGKALDTKIVLDPLKFWKLKSMVILGRVQTFFGMKNVILNKNLAEIAVSHYRYDNSKFLKAYNRPLISIELSIQNYVKNYLQKKNRGKMA